MKNAKKILSFVAVFALTATAGLSVSAALPDPVTELAISVQDFDTLEVGAVAPEGDPSKGALLGPQWWATPYAGAEVVQRAEGNNWLKIPGNGANPYGSPIRTQKFVNWEEYTGNNVAPADSDTFMFYVKGDEAKELALLPIFYENHVQNKGYVGGRFAATEAAHYTLINAAGEVEEVTSPDLFTRIAPGFEGWVIYPLDNATYRYDDEVGDGDSNTQKVLDPGRILAVEMQVNCDSSDAVLYVDDMAMTSDAAAVINALKAPAPAPTDPAPEGLTMFLGQGFGKVSAGDGLDALQGVAAIQGEHDATNIDFSVADNTLGYGNALQMTIKGDAGNFVTTNYNEIGLHFSDEDRAAMEGADSLVMRIKAPSTTKYPSFDLDIMLEESVSRDDGSRDRGGVGGVFMQRGDFAATPCDVILVDAATNQYVVNTIEQPFFASAGFDGWVVLPLSYFKLHPGYAGNDKSGELEVGEIVRMKFQLQNVGCTDSFILDTVGVAKADDFMKSLKATEKVVDKEVVMAPDAISPVAKDDFQAAKDNGVDVLVKVEGDYLLHSFLFKGADITAPADFDATLDTAYEGVDTIKGMFKPFTGNFFKVNALPGKATMTLYVEDMEAPVLYAFDGTKATKAEALTCDDDGYVTFDLTEGGMYFISDGEVAPVEGGTTPETPETPETPSTGMAFPAAAAVLALGSAAAVALNKKKNN